MADGDLQGTLFNYSRSLLLANISAMKVHLKHSDKSYFLYETTTDTAVIDLLRDMLFIYHGQLIIRRLCSELKEVCNYGIFKAPNESSENEDKTDEEYEPKGGYVENIDPDSRRNGHAPNEKMADVIKRTVAEAESIISNENVVADISLTKEKINDIFEMLSGAVRVVYPQGLPNYEPSQQLLDGIKYLDDVKELPLKEILSAETTELWWAGKQLVREKKLKDYVGKNEKTKIVVKFQKSGCGPPSREPGLSEQQRRELMLLNYKRQEELKSLEENSDLSYLDSEWADRQSLHRNFHGVEKITWKPN
ncbi:hypothetical protein CHUAL_002059 [Chamberlinius hualienensis]